MLKEFHYKEKNRKVLVTEETASTIAGIDFSYASSTEEAVVKLFIEKYDKPRDETLASLPEAERQVLEEARKAEWSQYMKWYRKYLKTNIEPVKITTEDKKPLTT